jgi:hypothetical protein
VWGMGSRGDNLASLPILFGEDHPALGSPERIGVHQ